jgi:hypothetical protein
MLSTIPRFIPSITTFNSRYLHMSHTGAGAEIGLKISFAI